MFQRYSQEEVLQIIKKDLKPDHALVFDCDGTLIDGDVSTTTGWFLMKDGMVDTELIPVAFREASFYLKMNLLDYSKIVKEIEKNHGAFYALEWELFIQSGLPHSTVVDYAHRAIDFAFENNLVRYTSALPLLLRDHTSQSWVVSGSSYPCVVALCEKMKLKNDHVLATRLELVDGIYQKKFLAPGFIWESNKVEALKEAGVESPYFVAGDTYGDWQMMEKATHWVWCMIWKKRQHGARGYRQFLTEKLPFGQDIPEEAGFYVTEWQRKHWVFQVE